MIVRIKRVFSLCFDRTDSVKITTVKYNSTLIRVKAHAHHRYDIKNSYLALFSPFLRYGKGNFIVQFQKRGICENCQHRAPHVFGLNL